MYFDAKKNKNVYNAQCNHGVNMAFCELHDSDEFEGMRANEMVKHMKNSPDWELTDMKDVQGFANKGEFVVGGWQDTIPGKSGHVNFAVPGSGTYGGWNGNRQMVPNMMDTGAGKREKSIGVNYTFGEDKQPTTNFYRYNPQD